MTNPESESVEPTPEAASEVVDLENGYGAQDDAVDATVVSAPQVEAPHVEPSEAEVEAQESESTAEAETDAPKSRTGLIAGIGAGVCALLVAAAVLITLAITSTGFFSKSVPDPAGAVKNFFAATTCSQFEATFTDAYWTAISSSATSPCADSSIKSQFAHTTYKIKSKTIKGGTANVVTSVTTAATATAAAQTGQVTFNLVNVDGTWEIYYLNQAAT